MGHVIRDCRRRLPRKVTSYSKNGVNGSTQQQFGVYGASDQALTIKVPAILNEKIYQCLVDTGASVSLIPLSVVIIDVPSFEHAW